LTLRISKPKILFQEKRPQISHGIEERWLFSAENLYIGPISETGQNKTH